MLSKEYLVEHYFNQGKTYEIIAFENNIDPTAVGYWMRRYGLKGRKSCPVTAGRNKHDLLGKRFGRLIVKYEVSKRYKDRQVRWFCECDCGGKIIVRSSQLVLNKVKSCHCLRRERTRWTGCGEVSGAYWYQVKTRAAAKGQDFDISIEYAWSLFLEQNKKCALSGVDINLSPNSKWHSKHTASLDRIDSTKGYIKDNVQWVHKDINKMKLHHSVNKFVEWCTTVANYWGQKERRGVNPA